MARKSETQKRKATDKVDSDAEPKRTRRSTRQSAAKAASSSSSSSSDPAAILPEKKQTLSKRAAKSDTAKKVSRDTKSNSDASATKSTKPIAKATSKPVANSTQIEREDGETCYWLMKAEPESRLEKGVDVKFSIDDLAAKDEPEAWDGVRNAVAQKNMRSMRAGELAFFYHSNCKVPGVAGVMQIVREQSADESAFDASHPYYDPKSEREKPRWCVVHVRFVRKFDELVPLKKLQEHATAGAALETLQTLKQSRLSVSRVMPAEWEFVLGLAGVSQSDIDAAVGKLSPLD